MSSSQHTIPEIVSDAPLVPYDEIDAPIGESDSVSAAYVDSGEVKLTFINYSKYAFRRDVAGCSTDVALGSITSSPGDTLKARSGMEVYDIGQIAFAWIAEGASNLYLTWYSAELRWRFGVRIVAPIQVFGMGPRPYWEVAWDRGDHDPVWTRSGESPSQPLVFFENGHFADLTATGRPESWHTALDVTVTITDYTEGKS